jgi:predicted DNA-binding protein
MLAMKQPTSFRLSEEALRLLKLLADAKGVSQASIIEMAVREMARKDGLK